MSGFEKNKSMLREEPITYQPGKQSAAPITKSHSPFQLLLVISISIFVSEAVIMVFFSFLPPLSTPLEVFLDSTLLLALLAPTLYFFLFRPLIMNITERKRAEKDAAVGRLAAGVAHELNNPIGNILLFSKLLLEDCPPSDERRENLSRLVDNAMRSRRIISALLNFTRQTNINKEPCDLKTLAKESLEQVRPTVAQRFFRACGFRVLEASSSVEGIAEVIKEPINAVIIKAQMPGLSGLDTAPMIKRIRPHLQVVITAPESFHEPEETSK